jgi:hypothetical protein
MNHLFDQNMDILKKTRVGGIIGIGGGGYDAWTSFTLPLTQIFFQHTRILIDQFQVNYCGLEEWNLWAQDERMTAEYIHQYRVQDLEYEKYFELRPQKHELAEVFKNSIERAKQLGRNVAQAMTMPIEEVKYVGEDPEVACPVCHSNVIVIPKALPYVACPVCYVRGEAKVEDGKMIVEWNMDDANNPRFSYEAVKHHLEWLGRHYGQNYSKQDQLKQIAKEYESYGTIIKPEKVYEK